MKPLTATLKSSTETTIQLFVHTPTNDILTFNDIPLITKIHDFKVHLELKTGILSELQNLYLSTIKLDESKTFEESKLRNGAVLRVKIKEKSLEQIYINTIKGDVESVFTLGVEFIHDDEADVEEENELSTWNKFVPLRAFQALFAASFTGNLQLLTTLLSKGAANLKMLSKCHRSCLHIAASEGHIHMISFMLSQGVDTKILDDQGFTAMSLAAVNGHSHCEKRIWLHNWNIEVLKEMKDEKKMNNKPKKKSIDKIAERYQDEYIRSKTNEDRDAFLPPILSNKDHVTTTSQSNKFKTDKKFKNQSPLPNLYEQKQHSHSSHHDVPRSSKPNFESLVYLSQYHDDSKRRHQKTKSAPHLQMTKKSKLNNWNNRVNGWINEVPEVDRTPQIDQNNEFQSSQLSQYDNVREKIQITTTPPKVIRNARSPRDKSSANGNKITKEEKLNIFDKNKVLNRKNDSLYIGEHKINEVKTSNETNVNKPLETQVVTPVIVDHQTKENRRNSLDNKVADEIKVKETEIIDIDVENQKQYWKNRNAKVKEPQQEKAQIHIRTLENNDLRKSPTSHRRILVRTEMQRVRMVNANEHRKANSPNRHDNNNLYDDSFSPRPTKQQSVVHDVARTTPTQKFVAKISSTPFDMESLHNNEKLGHRTPGDGSSSPHLVSNKDFQETADKKAHKLDDCDDQVSLVSSNAEKSEKESYPTQAKELLEEDSSLWKPGFSVSVKTTDGEYTKTIPLVDKNDINNNMPGNTRRCFNVVSTSEDVETTFKQRRVLTGTLPEPMKTMRTGTPSSESTNDTSISVQSKLSYDHWLKEKKHKRRRSTPAVIEVKQGNHNDVKNRKNNEAFEKWLLKKPKKRTKSSNEYDLKKRTRSSSANDVAYRKWLEKKRVQKMKASLKEKSKSATKSRKKKGLTYEDWLAWKKQEKQKQLEELQRLDEVNESNSKINTGVPYEKWIEQKKMERKQNFVLEKTKQAQIEQVKYEQFKTRWEDPHLKTYEEWYLEKLYDEKLNKKRNKQEKEIIKYHPEDSSLIFDMWLADKNRKEIEKENKRLNELHRISKDISISDISESDSETEGINKPIQAQHYKGLRVINIKKPLNKSETKANKNNKIITENNNNKESPISRKNTNESNTEYTFDSHYEKASSSSSNDDNGSSSNDDNDSSSSEDDDESSNGILSHDTAYRETDSHSSSHSQSNKNYTEQSDKSDTEQSDESDGTSDGEDEENENKENKENTTDIKSDNVVTETATSSNGSDDDAIDENIHSKHETTQGFTTTANETSSSDSDTYSEVESDQRNDVEKDKKTSENKTNDDDIIDAAEKTDYDVAELSSDSSDSNTDNEDDDDDGDDDAEDEQKMKERDSNDQKKNEVINDTIKEDEDNNDGSLTSNEVNDSITNEDNDSSNEYNESSNENNESSNEDNDSSNEDNDSSNEDNESSNEDNESINNNTKEMNSIDETEQHQERRETTGNEENIDSDDTSTISNNSIDDDKTPQNHNAEDNKLENFTNLQSSSSNHHNEVIDVSIEGVYGITLENKEESSFDTTKINESGCDNTASFEDTVPNEEALDISENNKSYTTKIIESDDERNGTTLSENDAINGDINTVSAGENHQSGKDKTNNLSRNKTQLTETDENNDEVPDLDVSIETNENKPSFIDETNDDKSNIVNGMNDSNGLDLDETAVSIETKSDTALSDGDNDGISDIVGNEGETEALVNMTPKDNNGNDEDDNDMEDKNIISEQKKISSDDENDYNSEVIGDEDGEEEEALETPKDKDASLSLGIDASNASSSSSTSYEEDNEDEENNMITDNKNISSDDDDDDGGGESSNDDNESVISNESEISEESSNQSTDDENSEHSDIKK